MVSTLAAVSSDLSTTLLVAWPDQSNTMGSVTGNPFGFDLDKIVCAELTFAYGINLCIT